ncbi:glutaredoxin 2 [Ferrimonas aestuarii]|uniref:Glutaredoxin 2 n=1 Tax=Ferrimonas aestuarii TaxID=2569539 RepID=A0A4U1BS93_9GAMM|nr:glutaredoxin 2 [Ferrimonas aestuarii]TKB58503.1 glutaredoxin 2 [Ferrimonas aestuarii]
MKLYVFDSCPYCTRVRSFLGLTALKVEVVPLVFGERPLLAMRELDRFTVPMLASFGVEGKPELMTESLEIIRHLDNLAEPQLDRYQLSGPVSVALASMRVVSARLLYPRMPNYQLPELGSIDALAQFESSRVELIGQSFEQALNHTHAYLSELQPLLETLESVLNLEPLLNLQRGATIDDLAVFSELRNLTMITELRWSCGLKAYLDRMSQLTQVPLYGTLLIQEAGCK